MDHIYGSEPVILVQMKYGKKLKCDSQIKLKQVEANEPSDFIYTIYSLVVMQLLKLNFLYN